MGYSAAPRWWIAHWYVPFATIQGCQKNRHTNCLDLQRRHGIWNMGNENSNVHCAATAFGGILGRREILRPQNVLRQDIAALQAIQHHQMPDLMTTQFSVATGEVSMVQLSVHFAKKIADTLTASQTLVCTEWYSCAHTISSLDCADSPRCWLHRHISQSSLWYAKGANILK